MNNIYKSTRNLDALDTEILSHKKKGHLRERRQQKNMATGSGVGGIVDNNRDNPFKGSLEQAAGQKQLSWYKEQEEWVEDYRPE